MAEYEEQLLLITSQSRPAGFPLRTVGASCGFRSLQLVGCFWSASFHWSVQRPHVALDSSRSAQTALVELLSATVVLLQFVPTFGSNSARASKSAGILLYVLAGLVVLISILGWIEGTRPETSLTGIGITAAALVVMPVLAWTKRSLALKAGNIALAADALQSATCAYLAAITLAALGANALLHVQWLNSAAALIAVPMLVKEANAVKRGEGCGCC